MPHGLISWQPPSRGSWTDRARHRSQKAGLREPTLRASQMPQGQSVGPNLLGPTISVRAHGRTSSPLHESMHRLTAQLLTQRHPVGPNLFDQTISVHAQGRTVRPYVSHASAHGAMLTPAPICRAEFIRPNHLRTCTGATSSPIRGAGASAHDAMLTQRHPVGPNLFGQTISVRAHGRTSSPLHEPTHQRTTQMQTRTTPCRADLFGQTISVHAQGRTSSPLHEPMHWLTAQRLTQHLYGLIQSLKPKPSAVSRQPLGTCRGKQRRSI
jgi:hypothetical protein